MIRIAPTAKSCSQDLIASVAVALIVSQAYMASVAFGVTQSSSTVVMSFGHNGQGQGGIIPNSCCTLVPTPIDSTNLHGTRIVQVAAGEIHSLLLSNEGLVYSFGSNYPSGQTGLGTTSEFTAIATPIATTHLAGKKIVQMATTWQHNLLLADDGTVFSFGSNRYGQTGLGACCNDTLVATPIDTANLSGKSITQVGAGDDHSLLLADDGTVFSFGYNGGGTTGLGTSSGVTLLATPIDTSKLGGKRIVKIAAGRHHNLLLSEDGTVFAFGSNEAGATGLGIAAGSTLVATPINMSNLADKMVTEIAANGAHSLLLTSDGNVFSFGENEFGQTGQGTTVGNTTIATQINTTNLAGKRIAQIVAGSGYSFLLADDGTAFTFGSNFAGATGLGTDIGKTLIATPISMGNLPGFRVIGISGGFSHSLLIAVPEPSGKILILFVALSLVGHRGFRATN